LRLRAELSDQAIAINHLELQLAQLKKVVYGAKSEKLEPIATNSLQVDLFPNDKIGEHVVIKEEHVKAHIKKTTAIQIKHNGRNALPSHLRRETIVLAPTEDVSGLKPIGEQVIEVLEYKQAELFVKRYVRPEYLVSNEDKTSAKRVIAALPNLPIEKSYAGASLLSHILIDKFNYHMPIHRQLKEMKNLGVVLSDSTISNWVQAVGNLLEPLYQLHRRHVFNTDYLKLDETTIKVCNDAKKGKTHTGYYWVYHNVKENLSWFDYQPGRGGMYPREALAGFSGYLQTDGYSAYEQFDKSNNIEVLNCWAHARRKFYDAQNFDKRNATIILGQIQALYEIERYCKEQQFDTDGITQYRQQNTVPILNTLKQTLEQQLLMANGKNPYTDAIAYTLGRWRKLELYAANGSLQIDNNTVENVIRQVALGRKNYLFAGSDQAAKKAGGLYSLIEQCNKLKLDPHKWLTHVLENIKETKMTQLDSLLPIQYYKLFTQQ
jgi:transposase